jgi:hypothetical protein
MRKIYVVIMFADITSIKNGVFWDVMPRLLQEPTFQRNLAPSSSGWQESVN